MLTSGLRPLHTETKIVACIFPFFSYSSSFAIKMHARDAKTQKIEPYQKKFFWTKV